MKGTPLLPSKGKKLTLALRGKMRPLADFINTKKTRKEAGARKVLTLHLRVRRRKKQTGGLYSARLKKRKIKRRHPEIYHQKKVRKRKRRRAEKGTKTQGE